MSDFIGSGEAIDVITRLRESESSVFRGVEAENLTEMVTLMEHRSFEKGRMLFEKGSPGDAMYLILSGQVRIFTTDRGGRELTLALLGEGQVFGELSIIDGRPRSASAVASEPLEALILHRDDFLSFIEKHPATGMALLRNLAERVHYTTTYLESVSSVFRGVRQEDLDDLVALMERQAFSEGELLFEEGSVADSMYMILSGRVRVYTHDDRGDELTVAYYGENQVMGELSLLAPQSRSASAVTIEPTEVLILRRGDFLEFAQKRPPVIIAMMRNLAKRVRHANVYLESLSSVFRGVGPQDLEDLLGVMEKKTFRAGEVLFRQGSPGDCMYLILSGRVRIYIRDEQGNELTLRYYGENQVVGELSVLDAKPRSASASAAELLEVLTLERDEFLAFVRERPLVGITLMRNMAGRVRYTTTYLEKVMDWATKLAKGDYGRVLEDMSSTGDGSDIQALIATFLQMARSIKARSEA